MTTLTIRIDEKLKKKAAKQAEKLGIPLTLVIKNTLMAFVESPRVIIGHPETLEVTPGIQEKMDKIGRIMSKM